MKQYHFPQIDSTNEFAKELLKTEEEVVVTADYQTRGRGRSQRIWQGEYGQNIYFSLGINHDFIPARKNFISYQICGCLAVKQLLHEATGKDLFKLKYPNDVHAQVKESTYRKISGVLVEHTFLGDTCKSTVIGIGININQVVFANDIAEFATSLKLLGYDFELNELVENLIRILNVYLQLSDEEIINRWKKLLNIEGKQILIIGEEELWTAQNIDPEGRLILHHTNTEQTRKIDDGLSIRYSLD